MSDISSPARAIAVKNFDGEPDTTAKIIVQNKIDYTPKVSVIIPVYNAEKYLRKSLNSVLKQTLNDIEIICVDDGSTDKSLNILKAAAAKDKRITIIQQANLYAGVARNAGMAVAKGEYLSFLDADDYFEPDMLEKSYQKAKEDSSDVVIFRFTKKDCSTSTVTHNHGVNEKILRSDHIISSHACMDFIFQIAFPPPWNKLFRRAYIEECRLRYQSLIVSNDLCFVFCALSSAKRISYLPGCYLTYNIFNKGSLSGSRQKYPFVFLEAYVGLRKYLMKNGSYRLFERSYCRTLASTIKWTANLQTDKEEFYNSINNLLYKKLGFSNIDEITQKYMTKRDLYISLTSHPARINTVHLTIESLLAQSLKADKVILWLAPEQFPNKEADLPEKLLALKSQGLTIDWYHDIKSYKKLIPALHKYPEAIIVTADDDNIYRPDWLKKLYTSYQRHPEDIHCHRATKFYYASKRFYVISGGRDYYKESSYLNKLVGLGGVLYPPHCFHQDILNEDLIQKLAPTNDDQWFWIMGALEGHRVRVVDNPDIEAHYVEGTQESGLTNINDQGEFLFWKDFNRLIDYYPQIKELLIRENNAYYTSFSKKKDSPYREQLESWFRRVSGNPSFQVCNAKTYNEKLQWLKLYDSTPLKTKLADKYLVREWIKEKIGEKYLIPLLGVYDRFEDIDFDKLPNRFVMKCNHGSGYNIIVNDKSQLDIEETKNKINRWMNENFAFRVGCELHYRDIQPKIVIEKFLDEIKDSLYDYRFFCFGGKVRQIWLDVGSGTPEHKRKIYDNKWNELDVIVKWPRLDTDIPKPDNLENMIELSEKLAKGFAHVRVDFYRMDDGKIYFGEMTFSSMSGTGKFEPSSEDERLGAFIHLPKLAYDIDTKKYYKLPKPSKLKPYLFLPYYLFQVRTLRKYYFDNTIAKIIKNLRTMRVDIKNKGTAEHSVYVNAEEAVISQPKWFVNNQGKGQIVESANMFQKINITNKKDGKLTIHFRGCDKRYNNERLCLYIDYKSIKVDGKEILSAPVITWHDQPFRYEMPVKDGQKVSVEVNQVFHAYSINELEEIIIKLYPNSDYIHSHLKEIIQCVHQILISKSMIN